MFATQTEKKIEYDEMTRGKLQQLQSKVRQSFLLSRYVAVIILLCFFIDCPISF